VINQRTHNKPCWEFADEDGICGDEELDEDKLGNVEDEVIEADEHEWRNDGLHVGLPLGKQ
jgi:hypothetical protein